MSSLHDDLSAKIKKDPRLKKRGSDGYARGLLLFNAGEYLNELWQESERYLRFGDPEALHKMRVAVEKLRPLFR